MAKFEQFGFIVSNPSDSSNGHAQLERLFSESCGDVASFDHPEEEGEAQQQHNDESSTTQAQSDSTASAANFPAAVVAPDASRGRSMDNKISGRSPELLLSDIMQGLQGGSDEKLKGALRELATAQGEKGSCDKDAGNLERVMKLLGNCGGEQILVAQEGAGESSAVVDVAKAMMHKKNVEVQQLQNDLADRDDKLKELQSELQQERDRSKLLAKEMTAREAAETSTQDNDLRQALEKIHLLEIENQHLTEACNAATSQNEILNTAMGETGHHDVNRKSKEELLEAIELIAKQENGLLRSIISQLKEEISQRLEVHATETKALQDALDKAHSRYQADVCGEFGGLAEAGLEEELRVLGEELAKERWAPLPTLCPPLLPDPATQTGRNMGGTCPKTHKTHSI